MKRVWEFIREHPLIVVIDHKLAAVFEEDGPRGAVGEFDVGDGFHSFDLLPAGTVTVPVFDRWYETKLLLVVLAVEAVADRTLPGLKAAAHFCHLLGLLVR